VIHEVEDGDHIRKTDSSEEDHWLRMRILFQHNSEEGTACGKHQFVCSNNIAVTNQSDIEEVVVIPDVREGGGDVGVEVVPAETKLFRCHVAGRGEPQRFWSPQVSGPKILEGTGSFFQSILKSI